MEKMKSLAQEHKSKLLLLFLGGAILAGINTFFGRADYNLFIYLYMSYIWKFMAGASDNQAQEKSNTLKIDPEGAIHSLVILTSWIGILLKIVIICMIGILDWDIIKSALPQKLLEKLNQGGFNKQVDEVNGNEV